jgi:hypothetical protein
VLIDVEQYQIVSHSVDNANMKDMLLLLMTFRFVTAQSIPGLFTAFVSFHPNVLHPVYSSRRCKVQYT